MRCNNRDEKDCKSRKTLYKKNFTYTKKIYVQEIAAVDLSKIYFLKNAKKTCKTNNRDLNRDWNGSYKLLKNHLINDILYRSNTLEFAQYWF